MDMHSFWLTRYYALWKQRRRLLGNWEERDVSSQDANHWCKTSVEDNWPCNLEALHCCTLIPPNGTLRSMTSACRLTRVIWQIFLEKKNSAGCLLKTKWLMKICIFRGTQIFPSNYNVQFLNFFSSVHQLLSFLKAAPAKLSNESRSV